MLEPFRQFHFYMIFPFILLMGLLSACGGGVSTSQLNIGTGALLIEFPSSLERHLTDSMQVEATITLDGDRSYALVVDKNSKNVTGVIKDISTGKHTLVVQYFSVDGGERYSIATGKMTIDIGDIEIINLAYEDFIYSDDDKDGITNIAELQLKTNPFDSQSVPAAHGLHGSENYNIRDDSLNSSTTIGISRSANYTIQ